MTYLICFSLCFLVAVQAQVYEDHTFYNVLNSPTARLIDINGSLVNFWQCTQLPSASMPYLLLPDSTVLRAQRVLNPPMNGAGAGGHIQLFDWDGAVLWEYIYSSTNHQQHHDIQPMPNGNVLLIAWDRKTRNQAIAMGRVNIVGEMWPTEIVELNPSNDSIVWEWHLWDHLIQDVDPGKPNYGVISEHPELCDINFGPLPPDNGDWLHANFIDYNEELDQIILSSHNFHEIYVIDHSTTTAEAAGHTGGNSGMGGDLLYRWGNPRAYDRGGYADQHLFVVHGVNWIDPGLPGADNILLFNNGDRPGSSNDYSSVEEIIPPLNGYNYYIHSDSAFGPGAPTWIYSNPGVFYSKHLSGAFRLSNGNTIICEGTSGYLFEVTSSGQVVWNHYTGGETQNAKRYDLDASGIEDIPLYTPEKCGLVRVSPNPFKDATGIKFQIPSTKSQTNSKSQITLKIYDATGRLVKDLLPTTYYLLPATSVAWDGRDDSGRKLPAGVYFVSLSAVTESDDYKDTRALIFMR